MKTLDIKQVFQEKITEEEVVVFAWLKFYRDSGKISFLEINDGTTIKNLQVVCKMQELKNYQQLKDFTIASAVKVVGVIKKSTNNNAQIELVAKEIALLKKADENYPLQNKQHSLEFLRDIAHLRIRSSFTQAIMRVRNELTYAIHSFFHDRGYINVASPIITSNDCEGAGENFVLEQDKKDPFFNKRASLTVSGQLNAESYALGMKKVYTFGPTFRAEKSHTSRHLAEFWMVEPEIAFINLPGLLNVIETMFKNIVSTVIKRCPEELVYLHSRSDSSKMTVDKLNKIINSQFIRLDYSEAIKILSKAIKDGHKFEDNDIFFGKDLASEHERYLCEQYAQSPVFLCNFPKEIKAFYMKANPDGKTVAAADLLVPGVGEIVGGSQRESEYNLLVQRCKELKIDTKDLEWYLDLRRFGYYMSSGFGLGFERILMYVTGVENIRDVIPFPRTTGGLKF